MTKKTVLSGLRPTGTLHIGHIKGAIENWVKLQDEFDCYYTLVDWHALTSDYENTEKIKQYTFDLAAEWLAVGLDPEKATIFIQSQVPEHAELHLLFSMITPIPWLERVPTYKEQKHELKQKDLSTYGFLGYPVLQTADIAIYRANFVPVGEDQVAHIELSREIVRRFNSLYGNVFPEPQPKLTKVPRLPGLDGRKMSKSYNNAISLTDDSDSIMKKVKTMLTDPARQRRTDPGNPEICPVFDFHKVFSTDEQQKECAEGCKTAGIGCIDCKKIMASNLADYMAPMTERRISYMEKPALVREILNNGAVKARKTASESLQKAREAMKICYDR